MAEMPCPICHKDDCVYERMAGIDRGERYFINDDEVTEEEFVRMERLCGFHNTLGHQEKPATGGFSNGTVNGRVEYAPNRICARCGSTDNDVRACQAEGLAGCPNVGCPLLGKELLDN
jgi:hypothetical protein